MIARTYSSSLKGVSAQTIIIECDTSNSLPGVVIVGLGTKAVDEAKERIRSAIKNCGLSMPRKRITINLAPADVPKLGAGFDLPMALAILLQSGQIPEGSLDKTLIIGELGLDGSIKPIKGVIGHILSAKKAGFKSIYIPYLHKEQASMIDGIEIFAFRSLEEIYRHLLEEVKVQPIKSRPINEFEQETDIDFAHIKGQQIAKRALEIAAAGGHNILLTGPPGTGKTMLAKAFCGILPQLDKQEVLEVTHIHSLKESPDKLITQRPFRSPHHSASHVAILGGGKPSKPGEISLAHRGVLFLDEFPEFSRLIIEGLRQPLEDRTITIARSEETLKFPANFILVCTQNPCPCGFWGDSKRECTCSAISMENYRKKLSGPILDRIDLIVQVDRIENKQILDVSTEEKSIEIVKRVKRAQKHSLERQKVTNGNLSNKQIAKNNWLDTQSKDMLDIATDKLNLSPRAYIKSLKVARTIADLDSSERIHQKHIAEALQYRMTF